jgi:hypothetical protein
MTCTYCLDHTTPAWLFNHHCPWNSIWQTHAKQQEVRSAEAECGSMLPHQHFLQVEQQCGWLCSESCWQHHQVNHWLFKLSSVFVVAA